MIRLDTQGGPEKLEGVILTYVKEAKGHAAAGQTAPKDTSALSLPADLVNALHDDSELSEAFHALTRGRQKSYVINLNGAKKPKTRINRIKNFRSRIIAGKGANER